jgi:hypothetical protein
MAGHPWLTPVTPATQEAEVRRSRFEARPGKRFCETLSQKTLPPRQKKKIGLVLWLKVKALSSNPSTVKKKKKKKASQCQSGMMTHACNPSYLGDGIGENVSWSPPAPSSCPPSFPGSIPGPILAK